MYSVSNQMPMQNYEVVAPAENQTNFLAGQTIRFNIPRNVGFWDPHTSYLRLQVAVENMNYKMCFVDDVTSLIDMIRVSHQGTTILETTNYNTLCKFMKDYSQSLSIKQKNATADGSCDYIVQSIAGGANWNPPANGPKTVTSGCLHGQSLNGNAAVSIAASAKDCKFNLPMDGVGLFDMPQLCPSIVIGDILVEIRLVSQNADALKVLPSTKAYQKITANFTNGDTTCVIEPHEFVGFTNLADSPFAIGMELRVVAAGGGAQLVGAAHPITNLVQANDTGNITITFGTAIDAQEAGNDEIVLITGTDQQLAPDATTRFVVKRADMMLRVVRPPQEYIESMTRKVLSEGLEIDINCYTAYQATIQAAIKAQTVEIPSFVARAKAVFTIPRIQNAPVLTNNGATDADYSGQYRSLKNYRWQIGTRYVPNQPIELDQFLGQLHFSAQHIVEIEKACVAAGIPVRSLLKAKQNFVCGRALAKHGGSVNLDAGLRLYLEYNAVTDPDVPLDVVSFVNHINRIVIGQNGLTVLG